MKNVLITGSSGFIGDHLVRKLMNEGNYVVGIDIDPPKYTEPDHFFQFDLRKPFTYKKHFDEVYNLACLMGGMGYIGNPEHNYDIMVGSTQIVSNVLDYCVLAEVDKLFYSSSACVYNMNKQKSTENISLKEEDAYPALPDMMYGWQKLTSELMCQSTYDSYGLDIRIARFHNIFGDHGTWDGGKEKAPAAICRKVAQSKDGQSISIWGDGNQVRSFLFIDECLEGIERLMRSDCKEPLNIGSDESVSINQLAEMVIEISGKKLTIEHDLTKPQGVRGRNSDNEMIFEKLGWKPTSRLYDGLKLTYEWIEKQVSK